MKKTEVNVKTAIRMPEMSTDGKNSKKQKEFDLYCIWKSLPPLIISPKRETVDEVLERLKIDDPLIVELVNIRTQGDFAKKYDVDKGTLSNWNKLISRRDVLADIRQWAKYLSKNIVLSMYNNGLRSDPKAYKDRENFLKVVNGWSDKLDVKHDVGDTLADLLRGSINPNDNGDFTDAEINE